MLSAPSAPLRLSQPPAASLGHRAAPFRAPSLAPLSGLFSGLKTAPLPAPFLAALLALLLGLWSALPAWASPGAPGQHRLLFLATSQVPPGKFQTLTDIAWPLGLAVQVQYVEKLAANTGPELFQGYDLVAVDSYQLDFIRSRLVRALPGLHAPLIWLYEDQPAWQGLPDDLARRLVAYYANGSRPNFNGFFRSLAAWFAHRPYLEEPAPIQFPKAGVYHPRAPGLVFATPRDYLAWKGVKGDRRPPTVAILLHQQYIAGEQTALVDDLIRRIEAAGALPLAVYCPVMDDAALKPLLTDQGQPLADVVINTQIMLNPEGRRREFTALGLPVIQAITYRRGDGAAWAADPAGVSLMDVPFYLAQPEYAGVTDIQVAAAIHQGDGRMEPLPAQAAAVVAKALNLVRLQRLPNQDKRLAVFFWNYPPGEKNLTASFLNLPASLDHTLAVLADHGYRTSAQGEKLLTAQLQRLLAPFYRHDPDTLPSLLRDNLAALLPLATYKRWFATLPPARQADLLSRWGPPEKSGMVLHRRDGDYFLIPRLQVGNLVFLPQPPRGEQWEPREIALYHSTKAAPSHFYLATYLWARQTEDGFGAHALVHFGTHGSQEWLPGKERGLAVDDYPMLAVGDLPVAYPYIADDVGEAVQAKRRGRAVIISHQPPPFVPAGLHDATNRLHDLLHAWLAQEDGAVKDKLRADLYQGALDLHIDKDLGWSREQIQARFPEFVDLLHNHLHELAQTAQPLGLHTLGRSPDPTRRIATVLMMLGKPFWAAASPGDAQDEALVGNYDRLPETAPYRLLATYLADRDHDDRLSPELRTYLVQARDWYDRLDGAPELEGLLTVLDGRYLATAYGGDPIRNPDAYPAGKNLYGFDPSRVPTPQAWAAGKEALDKLVAAHREKTGAAPRKLAFSLWSVETMRHMGILEAEAFWALGVEPVWDNGGRVTGVRLLPRSQLGRPRIDVVLSATGLYRDHFPNVMRWLAEAVRLAAEAEEKDNPVAANSRAVAQRLEARGLDPATAKSAAETRIFSSAEGLYGTGLNDATLASDSWKGKAEGDRKLAELYLARMQYAFGADPAQWGRPNPATAAGINLYAEQLHGTEAAVLSRSSNLYGMLTTDDPYQYLGGLSLAIRHLDGKAPELYIANLRDGSSGKAEGAAQFLAKELATRQFHPGYIQGLMAEGYAGSLQMVDSLNNFWGWTAVAREIVRDDQWQEFADVYVKDKYRLGLKDWFQRENPQALGQMLERMLEAARQGYWQADPATLAQLKAEYRALAGREKMATDNRALAQFAGFGLQAPSSTSNTKAADKALARPATPAAKARPAPRTPVTPPPVRGMRLERVQPPAAPSPAPLAGALILLLLALGSGYRRAARDFRPLSPALPHQGDRP